MTANMYALDNLASLELLAKLAEVDLLTSLLYLLLQASMSKAEALLDLLEVLMTYWKIQYQLTALLLWCHLAEEEVVVVAEMVRIRSPWNCLVEAGKLVGLLSCML